MSWVTIYSVDFSTLGNLNIKAGGNGAFTNVDNLAWVAANVGAASTLANQSGTGLRTICSGASAYDAVAVSAPILALPIGSISPIYEGLAGIRATAWLSSENISANGDTAIFAIDQLNGNVPDPSFQRYEWSLSRVGGAKGHLARLLLRGVNVVLDNDPTDTPPSDVVFQIEVPRVGHSLALLRTGNTFSDPYSDLVPRNELSSPSPFHCNIAPDLSVILGAASGAGGTNVVWRALRVEALIG